MVEPKVMSTIYMKVAAVQNALEPFLKTADNPFYNSKYVPLEAIQSRLKPLLVKQNLMIINNSSETQSGRWVITTTIRDLDSGEEIPSDFPLPQGDEKKEATSQQIGAGQSYGMRYNLKLLFNIIIEGEDDDGNEASKVPIGKASNPVPPKREPGDDEEPYVPNSSHAPKCSECGKEMKLRTSKTGSQFYGCTGYPKCKGTMKVSDWEKIKGDVPY